MKRAMAIACVFVFALACSSTSNKKRVTDTSGGRATTSADVPFPSLAPLHIDASGNPIPDVGGSAAPRTSAGPVASASSAPGAKALPRGTGSIKVGFHYSSDLNAAFSAFGANGNNSDVPKAVASLVAWVNARGGLGGKKVVAVLDGTNPVSGTFPEQAEKACTYFAEDAKVAYVVSGAIIPDDNMPACFARRNLPLIWDYQYVLQRGTFNKYPNTLYMPFNIGTDRMGFYAGALRSAGFFEKGAKIGIVRYDTAVHKEFADKVIRAGLAKYGLKVTDEAALSQPHSAGDAGTTANQAASAILRFNNDHITHLLWVPSGGAIPLIWGNEADSQHFTPRSAFTSLDIPAFVAGNMSADQLDRALVVGWMPANDAFMADAGKTQALEDCKAATGIRNNTDIVRYCDGLFFLKAALDKTPLYGVAGLRKAAEALGTGYRSPWTITTRLGPGRHDGATSYRILQYQPGCACFRFTSAGPVSIP